MPLVTEETEYDSVVKNIDFDHGYEYAPWESFREAELFLYKEARLLDTEQFDAWLNDLVDPDIRYLVLSREQRFRKEKRYKLSKYVPIYDDNFKFLATRVEQYTSKMYWRVDPPEHYRRLVTNIEVFKVDDEELLAVRSNCLASRARRVYEHDMFIYHREDVLRRSNGGELKLLRRCVDVDERCVSGRNLVMLL